MMTVTGCKTKKDLKSQIGQYAPGVVVETSMFGPEYKNNGSFAVVGPSAYDRRWYATITVENDIIVKVV